jgi:hypothetical protein
MPEMGWGCTIITVLLHSSLTNDHGKHAILVEDREVCTMANQNGSASRNRDHIVLVPGFGGFDALGTVEYYAGVTTLFRTWRGDRPVVLHYFDNLPTAAVKTRATRLRGYLAKRMVRGEILDSDRVVLVGHSTGGLDIRQLIWDLHHRDSDPLPIDGGPPEANRKIRECLDGVVFLSVPHWGTNIADWVHSHAALRTALVAELRAAVAGSRLYLLDKIETLIATGAALFTGAELLLAVRDALTEANANYGKPGPSRTADAEEAASDFALYFRMASSDFHAINDLTSQSCDIKRSPAHFDDDDRKEERELWSDPPIRSLSYATVGGRPFRFPSGCTAPEWELTNPFTYPEIEKDIQLSAGTDLSYRVAYRACAGGPFRRPEKAGEVTRVLGPAPPEPIEVWDNDGVVNTASMLWPEGEIVLVPADHLDIVGHYKLVEAPQPNRGKCNYEAARVYQSYDALQSAPQFTDEMFKEVWTGIFEFATNAKAPVARRRNQPKPVKATVGP